MVRSRQLSGGNRLIERNFHAGEVSYCQNKSDGCILRLHCCEAAPADGREACTMRRAVLPESISAVQDFLREMVKIVDVCLKMPVVVKVHCLLINIRLESVVSIWKRRVDKRVIIVHAELRILFLILYERNPYMFHSVPKKFAQIPNRFAGNPRVFLIFCVRRKDRREERGVCWERSL